MTTVPLPHLRLTLPADLPAIPAARQRVVEVLHALGAVNLDDGALLTSEVVSNAVEHAHTDRIEIRVSQRDWRVRVEVEDQDNRLPHRRSPAPDTLRGRGLAILDAYASAWGADPIAGNGKVVWFELPVHR